MNCGHKSSKKRMVKLMKLNILHWAPKKNCETIAVCKRLIKNFTKKETEEILEIF